MSNALKTRVYEFYDAYCSGKVEDLSPLFHEDVEFVTEAPLELFPYLGRRFGIADVVTSIEMIHTVFDNIVISPMSILVEGNAVSALISVSARHMASGSNVRLTAAQFFWFREERIFEYRAVLDTFEAVKQVIGVGFDE